MARKKKMRRMVSRANAITTPAKGIKRLGSLNSKIVCRRAGCGKRISRLAEKFNDPYCSRVCMALDTGIGIRSVKELFSEDFKKGARR